jgi:hypothetical protein
MSTLGKIFGSTSGANKQSSQPSSETAAPHPIADKPCPGMTEDDIPKVQNYLQHTGAPGGDSRTVLKIAMENFRRTFRALTEKHQKEVRDTRYHEQKWRNDHAELRIFSTACGKTVPAATLGSFLVPRYCRTSRLNVPSTRIVLHDYASNK